MKTRAGERTRYPPALRGCMRAMIVVKLRDPRFQEAQYILREDYLARGDRDALLAEARGAARARSLPLEPERGRAFPWAAFWGFAPGILLGAVLARLLWSV